MRIVIAALFVFSFAIETAEAEPINVMTWNIRYNNPKDGINAWAKRKEWVTEIIKREQSDIAGFQEVLVDQLDDLKEQLPHMHFCGVGRDDGKQRGEFSPIFYRLERFELLDQATFWLSPTPDRVASKGWDAALPRIATWVKLEDRRTGIVFVVLNTHFDHQGTEARAKSAALLQQRMREQFARFPVVLLGDLNTTPDSPPYKTLVGGDAPRERLFFDAYKTSENKPEGPSSTWNGFEAIVPNQRIDFVFTTKSVKVERFQILADQREGRFPSDHLPVVARIVVVNE